MSDAEPTDHSLLARFRRGSEDAAAQIYHRYARRLLGLARHRTGADLAVRVDAEDIVQSVFGSFFRGAKQGFYDVPDGEELWKLFLVLALNKIRAKAVHHRAAKRDIRQTRGGAALDTLGDGDAAAHAYLEVAVADALATLPPQYEELVALRVAGHEVADIAARTGHSRRTVERVLQKCRQSLTALFYEEEA